METVACALPSGDPISALPPWSHHQTSLSVIFFKYKLEITFYISKDWFSELAAA